jgi:D-xylose transport system permease protein
VSSAILGALVIASLDNGMGLLGWSAGNKLIVTGIVLVIAVLLDSFSRRRQKASGLG